MKRFKTLGLAGLIAAGMTLMVVSSASASSLVTGTQNASVSAARTGSAVWIDSAGTIECTTGGSMSGGVVHGATHSLEEPSWSAMSCSTGPFAPGTCGVTFNPGEQTSPGHFAGTVDIGPSKCGPVKVKDAYFGCEAEIVAQTGLGATFENIGSGSTEEVRVRLEHGGTLDAIPFTRPCGVPSGVGTLQTQWDISATEGGKQVGIHATAGRRSLFLSGSHAENEANGPKIETEFYPAAIQTTTPVMQTIWTPDGRIECNVDLASAMAGPSYAVTMYPSFGKTLSTCNILGFSGTVNTNGCTYLLHVDNAGPPYTGEIALNCPNGKPLEFVAVAGLCTIQIPTQILDYVNIAYEGGDPELPWLDAHVALRVSSERYLTTTGTSGLCTKSSKVSSSKFPTVELQAVI